MSKKRKSNLLDYFTASPSFKPHLDKKACFGLAANNASKLSSGQVPGLAVVNDFVSLEEESTLLAFLDQQQWRTDLSRRVIHYGGTYCLLPPREANPVEKKRIETDILLAKPIPPQLDSIIHRMIEHGLYNESTKPEFCIVNEYKGAQGISAHVENFRFKSPVCGLTLGQGDWMRFHELEHADDGSVRSGKAALAKRTGCRHDQYMPRRSLMVMIGEAREKWQHEIPRSKRGRYAVDWRRVSLTFRTDKEMLT